MVRELCLLGNACTDKEVFAICGEAMVSCSETEE